MEKTWIALHEYSSDVPAILIDLHELQVVRNCGNFLHLATRTHRYELATVDMPSNVLLSIMNIKQGTTLAIKVQFGCDAEKRF